MPRINDAKLEHLVTGTILIYVTVHLLEEGLFGFPAWALKRWGIPNYTLSKWLIHNVYFVVFLMAGWIIYRINKDKLLPAGLGVVLWGFLNALNHIVFSLIFVEYSPGLVTGLIFVLFAIVALKRVHEMGKLSLGVILTSLVVGVLFWGAPITLFISVDKAIGL
jgi:hypothetical protein